MDGCGGIARAFCEGDLTGLMFQIAVYGPLVIVGAQVCFSRYYLGVRPLCLTSLMCLLLAACCANEAPSEHVSPDGNWKYVTFDRNCGATTASNLQVSVL